MHLVLNNSSEYSDFHNDFKNSLIQTTTRTTPLSSPPPYDNIGAARYIVIVVLVYGLSIGKEYISTSIICFYS